MRPTPIVPRPLPNPLHRAAATSRPLPGSKSQPVKERARVGGAMRELCDMLEFEDFVYLDVQKTVSTLARIFLREFAATREIVGRKHRPVDQRIDGKIY